MLSNKVWATSMFLHFIWKHALKKALNISLPFNMMLWKLKLFLWKNEMKEGNIYPNGK